MSVKEKIMRIGWQGWGLYDVEGAVSTANALSEELIAIANDGFLELADLDKSVVQVTREANVSFSKFKSKYADFGADDTEVNEVAERLISDIFNVSAEYL